MSAERGVVVSFEELKANKTNQAVLLPTDNSRLSHAETQYLLDNCLSGLPIAEGVHLNWFEPALKQKPAEVLKDQFQSRYQTLSDLRKELGFDEPLLVSFEVAHALVDDTLFESVVENIKQQGKVLKTARHEIGHAHVAHHVGWKVPYISVIPSADYLGVTYSIPTTDEDFYTYCQKSAAIAFGGIHAAQMLGDEPRGGGSDVAKVYALARLVHLHYPGISETAFIKDSGNLSLAALRTSGNSTLEHKAHELLYKQQIAA